MKIILHHANGLQVGQCREDGYINLTNMAQASGKLIADYLRLDTTKAFLEELGADMGIPISGKNGLIQVRRGDNNKTAEGTWGHPQVAINCGQWCSPKFAVLVSKWVVDWMAGTNSPISQTEDCTLLPSAKAYIESSQALNRTIHTAIHQQTDSLRQALRALEGENNLIDSNRQNKAAPVETSNFNEDCTQHQGKTSGLSHSKVVAIAPSASVEPKLGRPKGKRSDPDYEQVTAYIKSETYTNVKIELLKEGQKQEFSELIQELLDGWLKSRT